MAKQFTLVRQLEKLRQIDKELLSMNKYPLSGIQFYFLLFCPQMFRYKVREFSCVFQITIRKVYMYVLESIWILQIKQVSR